MQREDKLLGCLAGAAIGDSMGGPTEERSTEMILEDFGGYVTDFRDAPLDTWAYGAKAGMVDVYKRQPYVYGFYEYNADEVAQTGMFAYHHDWGGCNAKGHTSYILESFTRTLRPGTVVFQAKTPGGDKLGAPYTVTVEEPVIETNAPQKIKLGSVFHFTTKLENTALSNEDVYKRQFVFGMGEGARPRPGI